VHHDLNRGVESVEQVSKAVEPAAAVLLGRTKEPERAGRDAGVRRRCALLARTAPRDGYGEPHLWAANCWSAAASDRNVREAGA
jgi:hypothetical protein